LNNTVCHPEYGFLEVLGEDGAAVREGEEGEIVATGFDNLVMPLIRYRTTDL
jgi:phenylacetate-CoA ligase